MIYIELCKSNHKFTQGFMGWGYMRLCCHLVGSWSLIDQLRPLCTPVALGMTALHKDQLVIKNTSKEIFQKTEKIAMI